MATPSSFLPSLFFFSLFLLPVFCAVPLLLRQPISSSSIPLDLPTGASLLFRSSSAKQEEGGVGIGGAVVAQLSRTSAVVGEDNKRTEAVGAQHVSKGRVMIALSELSHKHTEGQGEEGRGGGSLAKLEEALRSFPSVAAAVRTPEADDSTSHILSPSMNKHAIHNRPDQIIQSYRVLRNVGLVIIDFHPLVSAEEVDRAVATLWKDHPEVWLIEADAEVSFREGEKEEGKEETNIKGEEAGGNDEHTISSSVSYLPNNKVEEGNSLLSSFPKSLIDPLLPPSFLPNPADVANTVLSDLTALAKKTTRSTSSPPSFSSAQPKFRAESGVVPSDAMFRQQWALHNSASPFVDVRASPAWSLVYNNNGVRKRGVAGLMIGHIDTGCDVTHPDLTNNIWVNPGEIPGNGIDDDGNGFVDDVNGWNFDGDNNNVQDEHGHGTHTAGLVGAEANNREGIAGLIWDAKLIILKFKNNVSDAVQAIEYCLAMNIPLSTNSWGFNTPVESLRLVLEKTNQMKHLFVCAVDNKGRDNTWFNDFPPNYDFPNMIRVASVNSQADLDVTSDFSKTKVDIAAPGKGILSSVPKAIYGSLYGMKDGTSMATPLVAGLAGLMLSVDPDLDIYKARQIMMSTVTPLTAIESRILTGGIINCENSLKAVLGLPFTPAAAIQVDSEANRAPMDLFGGAGHVSEMLFSGFNDFMSGFLTRYARSVDSLRKSVVAAAVVNKLGELALQEQGLLAVEGGASGQRSA
eukprot:GHVS01079131.1.p1 GENE.GHVS01079131.1~~GHVS01079131.1.p1  ORF type:complete len:746 (+),score=169.99 GHVS01079131.1:2-2239(+)